MVGGGLACGLAATGAHAEPQSSIHAVLDPASVMQGDTVALTITGEDLPTGGVVVAPGSSIVVIKILSASATEIVAQIKVPSVAPPGLYNVIVYNQLGDEVFGQSLLTIGSGLMTPIFSDYDPKVIAEATSGFAVMLTGQSITPAAIRPPSMQWFLGSQRLTKLVFRFVKRCWPRNHCMLRWSITAGVIESPVSISETAGGLGDHLWVIVTQDRRHQSAADREQACPKTSSPSWL